MQRGVRFFFGGSVPMQRGTRFLIFDVHLGGARWAEPGRPKRYKTIDFSTFLKKKAGQQMNDQEQNNL